MSENTNIEVTDNPEKAQFEAKIDGKVAGIAAYQRAGHTIDFDHTEVDEAFEGQGVGSALVKGALDAVRAEGGLTVIATCPFVKSYIAKHAEYADLLSA